MWEGTTTNRIGASARSVESICIIPVSRVESGTPSPELRFFSGFTREPPIQTFRKHLGGIYTLRRFVARARAFCFRLKLYCKFQ